MLMMEIKSDCRMLMMVAHQSGLIVNISFWAAQKHIGNVAYGISKAATDKLTNLKRKFGRSYEKYTQAVGRWAPGRKYHEAD
jgi:NAD(P)-dependent dehydrogenase (short-subunit alcohol dehydrogenase family)